MLCRKPYVLRGEGYGCGQCMPCRFNRRRVWTHRLMLEALVHASASFVTLTYADEHCPVDGVSGRALQLFMKRLRERSARRVRFFGVGEYGDLTWRPHYHVALFGVSSVEMGQYGGAWPFGWVHAGELTVLSAQYVCGYVAKKMTRSDDERLCGRNPEFARMSLRPGIGAVAADQVGEALQAYAGSDWYSSRVDVPHLLRHGARSLPLGRYLRMRIRRRLGSVDGKEPLCAASARTAEMRALYDGYVLAEQAAGRYAEGTQKFLTQSMAQACANVEARGKVRASVGRKL